MRPDKAKVVDEQWDDARIESFLTKGNMGDEPGGFSVLLNAYRSMRPDDFSIFIDKYTAQGGDIRAPDKQGRTLLETIEHHEKAGPFRAILAAHS